MNANQMLTAVRTKYKDAYIIDGKAHKELIIYNKNSRTVVEFDDRDTDRMIEITKAYCGHDECN